MGFEFLYTFALNNSHSETDWEIYDQECMEYVEIKGQLDPTNWFLL